MFNFTDGSTIPLNLREEAELRLKTGTAPKNSGHILDQGALTLLHSLSSDPERAGDALKLLHELQVHQVELDLQISQIEANEHELAEAVTQFQTLYDFAPFAYFVVDHEGNIACSNHMAADLTGVDRDNLNGRRLDSFLQPDSRPKLLAILDQSGNSAASVEVVMDGADGISQALQIVARASQDGECILLACCQCPRTGQA